MTHIGPVYGGIMSWLFNDEALSEIAVLLNRMYNIQVVFKSEKVKALRFTGVITNNSLDNIIELISLTSPIIYTSKKEILLLLMKKSNAYDEGLEITNVGLI